MAEDRRKRLIDELLNANAILGHTPSSAEMDELHKRGLVDFPHSSYSSIFKTLEEAVLAAGLKAKRSRTRSKGYTEEELLSALRAFVEREGHLPTQVEFNNNKDLPSWFTYFSRFGSIKRAFALAGYDYDRCRNVLDKESMIKMLIDLSECLGRIPNAKDLGRKNGVPCRKSFERIFGSWSNALKAANLVRKPKNKQKKKKRGEHDKTKLLADYLRATELNGHHPSTEELGKKNGTHCYRTYVKVFGSWQNFQEIVEKVS